MLHGDSSYKRKSNRVRGKATRLEGSVSFCFMWTLFEVTCQQRHKWREERPRRISGDRESQAAASLAGTAPGAPGAPGVRASEVCLRSSEESGSTHCE